MASCCWLFGLLSCRPLGKKEIRFFGSERFNSGGLAYYMRFFPSKQQIDELNPPRPAIVGEASPGYMFAPIVARQIHSNFPQAKVSSCSLSFPVLCLVFSAVDFYFLSALLAAAATTTTTTRSLHF